MERPEQIQNFEVDEIVAQCEQYLEHVELGACDDELNDIKQFIFEAAMTSFYGPDVFAWIASKHK